MIHDSSADMTGKLVRQYSLEKADEASHDRSETGKTEFQGDEPPEILRQCRMNGIVPDNCVNNDSRHPQQAYRNYGDCQAGDRAKHNDSRRAGPEHSKDGRNSAQSFKAFAPVGPFRPGFDWTLFDQRFFP
jgi:hypothetical protein